MLSKEVRDALEAEREHLILRRRQINSNLDMRIKAIEALLGPSDDFGARQQALLLSTPDEGSGPLAGKGLREAMRTVLTAYPAGLRPAELTTKLDQLGYQATGTLPLKTRVWSEIGRLKREKRLQKRGKRYTWAVKEENPQAQEPAGEAG